MKKGIKYPFTIKILMLTTVTVFVWISSEVYRALTTEPPSPVPTETLEPLDPNLDTQKLLDLSTRVYLLPEEIGDSVVLNRQEQAVENIPEVTENEVIIEQ